VLGVYEEARVELLHDVFVFAYERSAAKYRAVRESLGEPDLFRLNYRTQLKEAVGALVRGAMTPTAGKRWLSRYLSGLPEEARVRFATVVESELQSLHDGNVARYRVTPSEFACWRTVFKGPRP
jgi:hypothetical protein